MIRLTIVLFLATLQLSSGEVPRLFTAPDFTAADFAEAVNHFVDLGQYSAIQELEQLASEGGPYHVYQVDGKDLYYPERVGWMCRALFEGRDGRALRPPRFGCLEDLPPPDLMETNWPQFPVAKSGSTYFVLSESLITVSGEMGLDDATNYIQYCRQNGVFRKRSVAVPSKKEVLEDLNALKKSAAWKNTKWTYYYNGSRYVLDERPVWKFIKSQAMRTK